MFRIFQEKNCETETNERETERVRFQFFLIFFSTSLFNISYSTIVHRVYRSLCIFYSSIIVASQISLELRVSTVIPNPKKEKRMSRPFVKARSVV